ncbi:SH3 domain-containing protein [Insolitispirillum peregrinum]|uniref:hypothetical protein n=1 Tax=Insolitispirillum peregrinum TaxID=80876 RepID=UPI00360AD72A
MKRGLLLSAVLVVFTGLGGLARYLTLVSQPEPAEVSTAVGGVLPAVPTPPRQQPAPPPPAPVPAPPPPSDQVIVPPAATAPEAPRSPAPTASTTALFTPQAIYPLARWHGTDDRGGEVLSAEIAADLTPGTPRRASPLTSRPLSDQDDILLAGWAGDPILGMRFRDVIISLCDQVIGSTAVHESSPAIARTVHPNLTSAGWRARLPVAFLPRCPQPVLQVWAISAGGYAYPVQGRYALALPPSDARLLLPTDRLRFAAPIVPESQPPLHRTTLHVTGTGANLRRCGQTSCAVTSVLVGGDYPAVVLDRRHGWTLVLISDNSDRGGWISDGTYILQDDKGAAAKDAP